MSNNTIADKLQDLIDAKADMKDALTEKGYPPVGGMSTYAEAINNITLGVDVEFDYSLQGGDENIVRAVSLGINNLIKRDRDYTQKRLELKNAAGTAYQNLTGWLEGFGDNTGNRCLTFCPVFDASEIEKMTEFFADNPNLIYVPKLNTTKATSMYQMFYNCRSLYAIGGLNTSKVTQMTEMFRGCHSLKSVPLLDANNVRYIEYMFSECYDLTNVGGLVGLGKTALVNHLGQTLPLSFKDSKKLTVESCVNVFNNLYDNYTWNLSNKHCIKLSMTTLNKLSNEDVAIATNKGWTVEGV